MRDFAAMVYRATGHAGHRLPTRVVLSSLRARLVLLVLLAVVPALGLMLYTAAAWRDHEAVEAQADALRLVRHAAADQERLIVGARELLVGLAQLPAARRGDPARCGALPSALWAHPRRYLNLGVIRPNGEILCSALPHTGPVNVGDRLHFRRAVETRDFAIGDYQIGSIVGTATLDVAYPVLDRVKGLEAVVFAALDLAWLSEAATEAQLPEGTVVSVMDQSGTLLARAPDSGRWVGRSEVKAPVFETILKHQGEGTAKAVGMDGVPRLFAFKPMLGSSNGGNLYVTVSIPTAVAFAEANRLLARNLAALGLVAGLAIVAAWVGSDLFILRRVRALVSATRRLSDGDLGARIGSPHGPGELSQLARAFDEMAAALQARQSEAAQAEEALRRARDELEVRVRERTAQLAGIIGSAMDAILTIDADRRIILFNAEAEQMFRCRAAEAVGQPVDRFIPERFRRTALKRIRAFGRTNVRKRQIAGARGAVTGLRADGEEFPIEVAISQIEVAGQKLYTAILRDMTERERAEAALRRLNVALELEARRIAHALHDEAGQLLAVVHIALEESARDLPPAARGRLQEVGELLDQIEGQLRRLSHELRPTILDDLGLLPALEFLAAGVSTRSALCIAVKGSTEGRLPLPIETALYRIVQEALTNVTKHAQATRVTVQIEREPKWIRCSIADDGIGFDVPVVLARRGDRGLGLIGIGERIDALRGALQVASAPGRGTELLIAMPLES